MSSTIKKSKKMEIEDEEEYNDNKIKTDKKHKKEKNKEIPINQRLTSRFLTKFERARIIGERAIEIRNNAPVYVEVENGVMDPIKIAEQELKEGKLNYVIRRYLPNGDYEDWKVNELIIDQ